MKEPWVKPAFEEMDVNGECTAYAGALRADPSRRGAGSSRQAPAPRDASDEVIVPREGTRRDRPR